MKTSSLSQIDGDVKTTRRAATRCKGLDVHIETCMHLRNRVQWGKESHSWQQRCKSRVCAQLPLTHCNPMDCNLPGSSVNGIFQARILELVAISSCRGSSWPRGQTCISCRRILYHWAMGKPLPLWGRMVIIEEVALMLGMGVCGQSLSFPFNCVVNLKWL